MTRRQKVRCQMYWSSKTARCQNDVVESASLKVSRRKVRRQKVCHRKVRRQRDPAPLDINLSAITSRQGRKSVCIFSFLLTFFEDIKSTLGVNVIKLLFH